MCGRGTKAKHIVCDIIIYRVCDIQVGKHISWINVRGEGGGVAGDKTLFGE